MQAALIGSSSVECDGLVIRTGRREIISDFSWRHQTGGIAWTIGSNGSGKSSLLRVLAGWQKPSQGVVRWAMPAPLLPVRYFTPAIQATPELNVADFMDFVGSFPAAAASHALDELFPRSASLASSFRQLSTGEAKRLLLWALFRRASAAPIIFDEPYEHLSRDAKHALTLLLQSAAAHTVVIIATNQDVPPRTVDTVLTVDDSVVTIETGMSDGH